MSASVEGRMLGRVRVGDGDGLRERYESLGKDGAALYIGYGSIH